MTTIINPPQERTGTIKQWPSVSVPAGWLVCDGSAVSRELYSGLFNVIGNTFGDGDGETTFNLPDLQDAFIEGCGVNSVGDIKTAGLPNITGNIGSMRGTGTSSGNGALYKDRTGAYSYSGYSASGGSDIFTIKVNAQNSNAIYGNSTTVQPPAVVMNYIIKF